jgi:hypothetical protein
VQVNREQVNERAERRDDSSERRNEKLTTAGDWLACAASRPETNGDGRDRYAWMDGQGWGCCLKGRDTVASTCIFLAVIITLSSVACHMSSLRPKGKRTRKIRTQQRYFYGYCSIACVSRNGLVSLEFEAHL